MHEGLGHTQWDKPLWKVSIEVPHPGFRIDFRPQGTLRGVVGFAPALYPPGAFPEASAGGRCAASGPPVVSWGCFSRALRQVVGGTCDFGLEYDASGLAAHLPKREGGEPGGDGDRRKVQGARDWEQLVDALHKQAVEEEAGGAGDPAAGVAGAAEEGGARRVEAGKGEVEAEIVLFKKASAAKRKAALKK